MHKQDSSADLYAFSTQHSRSALFCINSSPTKKASGLKRNKSSSRQQRKDNYATQTSRVPKDTSKKRSTTEDAQQLPQKATGTSGANAEGDTKSKVTPKTKVVPTSKEKTARDKNQAPSSRGSTVKTSNKSKKKSRSKRTNRKKPKLEEIQFD